MTEELKKITEEEISKLSKEKQEAINSIKWTDIIQEIGNKNGLMENETSNIQLKTLLFIIGLIDIETYKFNVEEIVVSSETTKKIVGEIFEKVFAPIANKIEASIKKKLLLKNPKWEQRVGFILSGGNYSVFLDK